MKKLFLSFMFICLMISCNQETMDRKIYRQARDFTRTSCPKPMDKYTVLDSLVYDTRDKVMTYHYSVSGILDTDSIYNSALLAEFHANLLNNIVQNTGLIELKKHSVTFRYCYTSATNKKLYMSFQFEPSAYK